MDYKNYSELSPSSCASLIIRDVLNQGYSSGWTGNDRDLPCLQKILETFDVKYVPDYQGHCIWKL